MKKIILFIKDTYKVIIIYLLFFLVLMIPLPFYIYAPGGLININDRVGVNDSYNNKGSLNLSYVSEYDGKLLTCILGLINKKSESKIDYDYLDKLKMQEAYSNATFIAYNQAGKSIYISDSKVYVEYVFKESSTNLQIGDQITHVNNHKIKNMSQLNSIINSLKNNQQITIKVKYKGKTYKRKAKIKKYKDRLMIGIGIFEVNTLKTNPEIKYNYSRNEYGPSGGLMLSLAIYNKLVKKDITHGKVIVGTGTINSDGSVGRIDGVEYKIKGVAKDNVDLFLVPQDNFKEALKVKNKNHYKFKIVGVKTFDEALAYLNDLVHK